MSTEVVELKKTPMYLEHLSAGARMVDFGGWSLPIHYGSQMEEHHAVRNDAGMFDVSHMTVTDLYGADVIPYLSHLLANDIAKISAHAGKALYSCMLNEEGGVIDDLIVYYLSDEYCRLVTNAATRDVDLAWMKQQASAFGQLKLEEQPDLALIAVQGPKALEAVRAIASPQCATLIEHLARFQGGFAGEVFVGRTGYTGEDGVEVILPSARAPDLWLRLVQQGVKPCGLGARDTLRLEAGMALYGTDLDAQHTPLESGLSWTVAMKNDRDFIGRQALQKPVQKKMIGLVLEGKGVLRANQKLFQGENCIGEITSGIFSPTLGHAIAMARVDAAAETPVNALLQVEIRNKKLDAKIVKYPFVKA